MLEYSSLIKIIKQAALDAVKAQKPAALCFGKVTSEKPLKITVDQKITLSEKQLILTDGVKDHTVFLSENGADEKKKYTVRGELRRNEKVLLLRADGGQKYVILSRTEG